MGNKEIKKQYVKIEIVGKRVEFDGKKFMSFVAYKKDGKKITCKFKQDCKNVPQEDGTYYIVVDTTKMNINTTKRYPEMWISEIERVLENEQMEIEKAKKYTEIFDELVD